MTNSNLDERLTCKMNIIVIISDYKNHPRSATVNTALGNHSEQGNNNCNKSMARFGRL